VRQVAEIAPHKGKRAVRINIKIPVTWLGQGDPTSYSEMREKDQLVAIFQLPQLRPGPVAELDHPVHRRVSPPDFKSLRKRTPEASTGALTRATRRNKGNPVASANNQTGITARGDRTTASATKKAASGQIKFIVKIEILDMVWKTTNSC
jgi:hypothetical protein